VQLKCSHKLQKERFDLQKIKIEKLYATHKDLDHLFKVYQLCLQRRAQLGKKKMMKMRAESDSSLLNF